MNKPETKWYTCPQCGFRKMMKIREDTVLKNFPGYCKMCKREILITLEPEPRARAN